MEGGFNLTALIKKHRQEIGELVSSLHCSSDEEQWMSLLDDIKVGAGKTKSKWPVLHLLRCLVLHMDTAVALRNLMHVFIRKISDILIEDKVIADETLATELMVLLKDFWAVCSNQDHTLSRRVFGKHSVELYDVLSSLASVYIDLFIASNRSKEKKELLSKRLYGWLNFELNDRCLKTALLEVSGCTSVAATLLLPILRKLLMPPPPKKSFMDYLLHFVLLRRWALVSADLTDVVQVNLNVKAPKNFAAWLVQRWPGATEHMPQDKSLKGRRISELMCSLDTQAVDELVDVFSQCLWASEEEEEAETGGAPDSSAADLFVVDKMGSEPDSTVPKRKRKREESVDDDNLKASKAVKVKSAGGDSAVNHTGMTMSLSNGHGKKEKRAKGVNGGGLDTKDEKGGSGVLGFVLDRTAEGKQKAGKAEVKEIEEDMEEDPRSSSDDDDVVTEDESDNEEEEKDHEDEAQDLGGFAVGVEEDSNEEEEEGEDDEGEMDDFIVDDEEEEEEGDDDEEEEDDDESENEMPDLESSDDAADGEAKESDAKRVKVSPSKSPAPTVFPMSSKDPAQSYFATPSTGKPEVEEIQVIESVVVIDEAESGGKAGEDATPAATKGKKKDGKATPRSAKVESLSDGSGKRKKRNTSESKQPDSDMEEEGVETLPDESETVGTRTKSALRKGKNVLDSSDTGNRTPKSRKSKRFSESSVDQQADKETNSDPLQGTEKVKREKSPTKSASKKTDGSDSIHTGEDVEDNSRDKGLKQDRGQSPTKANRERKDSSGGIKSPETKDSTAILEVVSGRKSKRIRSGSESSPSKTLADSTPTSRRLKRNSESNAGQAQEPEASKQKDAEQSPTEKNRHDSKAGETTTLNDENEHEEISKEITMSEEQIVLALTQIRKSVENSSSSSKSTRLRTKSEGSNAGEENSVKAAKGRKSLPGKKGKEEPSSALADWLRKTPETSVKENKPVSARGGSLTKIKPRRETSLNNENESQNDLRDWLQKTPQLAKAESLAKLQTASGQDSSSDGEIVFNPKSFTKTYAQSAERKKRSPKRLLIESTPKEEAEYATPGRKGATPRSAHGRSASSKQAKRQRTLSNTPEDVAESAAEAEKTPKHKVEAKGGEIVATLTPGTPSRGRKSKGMTPQSRRKYFLRGTSPIISPTGEITKNPLIEAITEAASTPIASPAKKTKASPAVIDSSPKKTTKSPAVSDSSPKKTTKSPAVIDSSPKKTTKSPAVIDSSPKKTAKSPAVSDSSPKKTAKSPAVSDSSPKKTAKSPTVSDSSPKKTAKSPAVIDSSPKKTAKSPAVIDSSSKKTKKSPAERRKSLRSATKQQ